jgi:hypothetical protein
MKRNPPGYFDVTVFAGDAVAILVATFIGLRFHQATGALPNRILYNWLPWLLAWLAAGLPLGLFGRPREGFWRIAAGVLWAALPGWEVQPFRCLS